MMLIIKINLFGSPLTKIYITEECFITSDDLKTKGININTESVNFPDIQKDIPIKRLQYKANALFLQPFAIECFRSKNYRSNVVRNVCEITKYQTVYLKLLLLPPEQEIIDYAWNERMLRLVWTRVEIENAFSWLSTLGGAYSALGDYFEYCAEEAGRISMRQFKLSKMLGDEGLAARSNLYLALSFSQKGQLKLARHIVRKVAQFAIRTSDRRLMKMCHGVWAKLKYLRSLKYIGAGGEVICV